MESKTFLDFLPTNFRHEKSFFIQNNLTEFEKLSNLSDSDINEILRKSSLCTLNNLKKIRAIAIFKKDLKGIMPTYTFLALISESIFFLSLIFELLKEIPRNLMPT